MSNNLKWQAVDAEDLTLISSALQDGVGPVGQVKFDAKARTMTILFNRFRWELPDYGKGQRVASILRIDGVLGVQGRGINRANPESLAVMLALEFLPDDEPPGGTLSLTFAGDGELRMRVEMIDMILADIGPPRAAKGRPVHDDGAA